MKLLAATSVISVALCGSSHAANSKPLFRYRVCGDFANQLASHASAISQAVRKGRPIAIDDEFIVDEIANSKLPLSAVFDTQRLLEAIWAQGVDAQLIPVDSSDEQSVPCFAMTELEPEDTQSAAAILEAFRPNKPLQHFVDAVLENIRGKDLDLTDGVCLHHLSSPDWNTHCENWSSIDDGIYRGNCQKIPDRTLVQSLEARSLTDEQRWIYYVGDGPVPQEILDANRKVVSIFDVVGNRMRTDLQAAFPVLANPNSFSGNFWSLVDSIVCQSLPHFVGNSIHFWSAIQIAMHQLDQKRNGSAYWYNSQSIPLAEYLPIYHIPIVYTYTELSAGAGKFMLKASISSVKRHMPLSKIHVMYHGDADVPFRAWLKSKDIIIHRHEPDWRESIEEMRQKGDPMRSHLFLHEGNYFGTWQRIDIPRFINSEYCLLMDADTIVSKPFTMRDFGLDITKGLAFSAEADPYLILPWNAGISLLNVPYLRETHSAFLEFIMKHVDGSPYDPDAPSDQGAYLDFYKGHVDFLSIEFNFKPYFQVKAYDAASARILHFHGPKPHHYIGHFLGLPCDAAAQSLCDQAGSSPFLCSHLEAFAGNLLHSGDESVAQYCETVYAGESARIQFCMFLLKRLGQEDGQCTSLGQEIEEAKKEFDASSSQPRKKYIDPGVGEFKYNICNGLSNQFVYHAVAITQAITQQRPVAIFDSFIYNGVQSTDENELPTAQNSVSFSSVFDVDHFFGKIADYGIEARLIASDWDLPKEERVPCVGMTALSRDESEIALDLIRAFRPKGVLKDLISSAKVTMKRKGFDISKGVCVHHRDGQDWHDHCGRWGSIPDGIYRGNCLNETKTSFLESLESRALNSASRWMYYVGDHSIPQELVDSKYPVVTKDSFLDAEAKTNLMSGLFPGQDIPSGPFRDLWSLIDFVMCDSLSYFVGNSVSSWSAVQLAVRQKANQIRDSGSYWYNSQSIPLADFLRLYEIPVVFVYTELSDASTKHLFRASVSSVKQVMHSTSIHVLYHGDDDKNLKTWLRRQGVLVHQHYPKWRSELLPVESSHSNIRSGEASDTTLFRRWQRIDVPKYVESEYCLLLEPGTIVERRFTMADFGLDLTWSIAFAPEHQQHPSEEGPSGVSLLNIPSLRRSHGEFLQYVREGFEGEAAGHHDGSVKGAYSTFYKETTQSLADGFLFQPFEDIPRHKAAVSKVVDFHDVKPNQYLGHFLGVQYDEDTDTKCSQAAQHSFLCSSLQTFSKMLVESTGSKSVSDYCKVSFPSDRKHREICIRVLKSLASSEERCDDLSHHVKEATQSLKRSPISRQTEDATTDSTTNNAQYIAQYSYAASAIVICGVFGATALFLASPKRGSFFSFARPDLRNNRMNIWSSMNVLLTVTLAHVLVNIVLVHRYSENECS